MQAEIASITCEQIARGGLRCSAYPEAWFPPAHGGKNESEADYSARCEASKAEHMTALEDAEARNGANLAACLRAARQLFDAQHHAEGYAILEHCRREWGVRLTSPPEELDAEAVAMRLTRRRDLWVQHEMRKQPR